MKNVYFEITSLTEEEFILVNNSNSAIKELKLLIPGAVIYRTVFCYNDELYHTDMEGKTIEKIYQKIGKFIAEIPKTVIEVPTGISEDLLIRAIAAASHQSILR